MTQAKYSFFKIINKIASYHQLETSPLGANKDCTVKQLHIKVNKKNAMIS